MDIGKMIESLHMRTTKRLLDDGSDVDDAPETFHIEEMQSDWHQYGRGQGYADPAKKFVKCTKLNWV